MISGHTSGPDFIATIGGQIGGEKNATINKSMKNYKGKYNVGHATTLYMYKEAETLEKMHYYNK